ncbi:MAG: hypothetical protein KDI38_26110 [Calditrichaeota bacterium]|nr:hypothetical protein [Calditrichota bacterium]
MGIDWQVFIWGTAGGFLAELLKWYNLRESPNMPDYARKVFYWLVTLLMIGVGGLLADLYGIDPGNRLLAINVGASAPLIIQTLMKGLPNSGGNGPVTRSGGDPGMVSRGGGGGSLFRFLRGE